MGGRNYTEKHVLRHLPNSVSRLGNIGGSRLSWDPQKSVFWVTTFLFYRRYSMGITIAFELGKQGEFFGVV